MGAPPAEEVSLGSGPATHATPPASACHPHPPLRPCSRPPAPAPRGSAAGSVPWGRGDAVELAEDRIGVLGERGVRVQAAHMPSPPVMPSPTPVGLFPMGEPRGSEGCARLLRPAPSSLTLPRTCRVHRPEPMNPVECADRCECPRAWFLQDASTGQMTVCPLRCSGSDDTPWLGPGGGAVRTVTPLHLKTWTPVTHTLRAGRGGLGGPGSLAARAAAHDCGGRVPPVQ